MIRTNPELLSYIESLYKTNNASITEERYRPKDVIIAQQKRYTSVYIIKEGFTKCYLSDENGREFIQEFLGEGIEFGELEVFTDDLSFCAIEAITDLVVYKISYSYFNQLLDKDKVFNRLVMTTMAKKISYKAPRHSYQQSYSIEDNIVRLRKLFPELNKVISKKDIANYIGVTLRSLNRTLSDLKKKEAL